MPVGDFLFDGRSEFGAWKVGDGFGFGRAIDRVGFLREAFEKFGKDRGAAGVDFGQWGEEFIGHFVKECRGGSAACDLMSTNLRKDPGVVRKTGFSEIGVGNDAGNAMGKIGEKEHRECDKVDLTGLEMEAFGKGLILSEKERVGSNDPLGCSGTAAGEGDEGGMVWRDRGDVSCGVFCDPAFGKGEFSPSGESIFQLAVFESEKLGLWTSDESLGRKPG